MPQDGGKHSIFGYHAVETILDPCQSTYVHGCTHVIGAHGFAHDNGQQNLENVQQECYDAMRHLSLESQCRACCLVRCIWGCTVLL